VSAIHCRWADGGWHLDGLKNSFCHLEVQSIDYFSISTDIGAKKVGNKLKKGWHAVCLNGFILGFGCVPPKF
jgi:hypothetical protein